MRIKLPPTPTEDFFAWHFEKMAFFSVRSAYHLARRTASYGGTGGDQTSVEGEYWKISLPHKVLIFGWKVIHNGLATQPNKQRRNILVSDSCEICGDAVESVSHALI